MQNKTVLIAGGSSGMGLKLTKRCLDGGLHVVIAGRSEERLKTAQASLQENGHLKTVSADISCEDQVKRLFEETGPVDHIVSTAADISGAYELLPSLNIKTAEKVIGGKIIGPLLLAKYGARHLPSQGSITYVSGIAAYRPAARGTVVAAANAALEGLIRALAIELAPIRANVVSPGWVDTPIWQFVAGDKKDETLSAMAARLPAGRIGQPADIADAIFFLMGNGFTTGETLHVDGGQRLA